ncbi:MAG: winged helix-turn-helix domain-containing protein [Putridiphycobacter sp.]|nr:winged helix-turn-helix domain-containing protein [Putridiphycobacter sp.]
MQLLLTKKIYVGILFCLIGLPILAQADTSEAHILITMRKIGHEVLQSVGDYSSRVLPIKKEENRYKISFENEFVLTPEDLATVIHPIILESGIAEKYRVEVSTCDSGIVVHGYEVGRSDSLNELACRQRVQPLNCYNLYVTIVQKPAALSYAENIASANTTDFKSLVWPFSIAILIATGLIYIRKKRRDESTADHITPLGKFLFDQRKMELLLKNNKTELTSKEADLLILLLKSVNETVEREIILSSVWGDEGDYIGRTLDVFISKLRKKLEADESVKIVNVRGVGYRLLVD